MLCLRCLSRAFAPTTRTSLLSTRQTPQLQRIANQQQRPLSLLSRSLTRPKLITPAQGSTKPLQPDTARSTFQPFQQPQSIQARGAIRDTFNPSHRVRKRRHGFLSRIKTRNGRKTLKRRRAKRRSTLSH